MALTAEQQKELKEMLDSGVPVKDVALKFNISPLTVYGYRYGAIKGRRTIAETLIGESIEVGECRLFKPHLKKSTVYYRGNSQIPTRVAYQEFVGEIPEGQVVMPTCGNSNCINVDHLVLGTKQQVTRKKSSITPEVAERIRKEYQEGNSLSVLGKAYKLSPSMISRIVNGLSWASSDTSSDT